LVSYYIISYNHENLIARAVESALQQDYSSLEIIISDDCSTDRTWGRIQDAISKYKGPHKVITRRNDRNLGIAKHINALWNICNGEWIVASAGDDTSRPNRVSRVMEIVRQSPRIKLVQSFLNEVDEHGNFIRINALGYDELPANSICFFGLKERSANKSYAPHGAAMAYSRELIDIFPQLPRDVIFEDNILNLRAELLGNAALIAEPLVSHTNHDGQITCSCSKVGVSQKIQEKRRTLRLNSDISSSKTNISDIILAFQNDHMDLPTYKALLLVFEKRANYFELRRKAILGLWPFKLLDLMKLIRHGNTIARVSRNELIRSALPYSVYVLLQKIRA